MPKDNDLFDLTAKIGRTSGNRNSGNNFGRGSGKIVRRGTPSVVSDSSDSKSQSAGPAPTTVKPTTVKDPVGQAKPKKIKRKYTPEEQRTLLKDYEQVPPNQWKLVERGTHIRYHKVDNTFVRGGFLMDVFANSAGKEYYKISNSLSKPTQPNYTSWVVALNGVKLVWRKKKEAGGQVRSGVDVQVVKLDENLKKMNESITKILHRLTNLNGRVSNLETKFNMMTNFLKQQRGSK